MPTAGTLARSIGVLATGILIGFSTGPSGAAAQTFAALPKSETLSPLDATGPARAITAWTSFCERVPSECEIDPAEPATIALDAKTWRTLNLVNRQVNGTIRPKTDQEHWGVVDRWDLPDDGFGDCEDYQLLKRKILAERYGLPRRALRMTVVIDDQGEGHAVLTARTDQGDLILDNKRSAILSWHQTGYVYVKREGSDKARDWVSLGERSSPTATAGR